MYTVHYAPDSASLVVRLVLDGAGIPYRTAFVDRASSQQDSATYRAVNPTGLIPTLETPKGPISETGAILLWLSDTHRLGPELTSSERGVFLKWLFFLSNTVHADLRQLFHPHQYVPAEAHAGHKEIIANRMLRHFGLLDAAATDHPKLFAPATPLGVYSVALVRWAALHPGTNPNGMDLAAFPALENLARAQEARVETRVIARAEGLGSHPFTRPELLRPSKGPFS